MVIPKLPCPVSKEIRRPSREVKQWLKSCRVTNSGQAKGTNWAWTWQGANERNNMAVEDVPQKKAEKLMTSQGCTSQVVGQGEQMGVP